MTPDLQQQIYHAATAAYRAVWEATPRPYADSAGLSAELASTEEHAADRYRQTVRTNCAELGVDERDYYLASPLEAMVFQPECLADELDDLIHKLAAQAGDR